MAQNCIGKCQPKTNCLDGVLEIRADLNPELSGNPIPVLSDNPSPASLSPTLAQAFTPLFPQATKEPTKNVLPLVPHRNAPHRLKFGRAPSRHHQQRGSLVQLESTSLPDYCLEGFKRRLILQNRSPVGLEHRQSAQDAHLPNCENARAQGQQKVQHVKQAHIQPQRHVPQLLGNEEYEQRVPVLGNEV